MKLQKIILKNFRAYSSLTEIGVEQLTALIGKNDIGKSSVLDALDIFFNQNKMDRIDRNVHCGEDEVIIGCAFSDFPAEVVLDETVTTSLENEYLLNEDGHLEIWKHYSVSGKESVYIVALHPINEPYDNLLQKKNAELKAFIKAADLQGKVNMTINAEMRAALWQSLGSSISFSTREICADKEEAKNIWQKLVVYLPRYHVFRSDRPSTDDDVLAQDPMQVAMKAAIAEKQVELTRIADEIKARVSTVADKTVEKLKDFDATLASSLTPQFKKDPAWDKAFAFSLTGDEDIPLNKRGSGIRRLVLFSFFRASCEEDLDGDTDVIYAVEEPETSQHPDFQKIIISTFLQMTENPHCQIILTTHVPGLAKMLPISSLRYITNGEGYPDVEQGHDGVLVRIADTLGVLPDLNPAITTPRQIRLIVCVEGVHDISFLKTITATLNRENSIIKPMASMQDIILLPMGGSSLQEWVNHNYLKKLNIPEYHIYDSDCISAHQSECDEVNSRNDGSTARMTLKREIENYIHKDAVKAVYGFDIEVSDELDVPKAISEYLKMHNLPGSRQNNVKKKLNEVATRHMSFDRLKERDPQNEVLTWICDIEGIDITTLFNGEEGA